MVSARRVTIVFALLTELAAALRQESQLEAALDTSSGQEGASKRYLEDIVGGRDAEGKELSADTVRDFLKWHNEKGNLPYGLSCTADDMDALTSDEGPCVTYF
ncbi:hypothetical protein AK812_SmicGene44173 [Symbiodinium microadriaticum]|uniref:Uncharacterized protein n=1 Tax=Symbiodinium microadriaticum TaxID=2951 RepID=A0A1Q9BZ53_SYMMI|nr:hypothetical protein AK812_SmicGene44173 [Symbiodinium microadriaticum]